MAWSHESSIFLCVCVGGGYIYPVQKQHSRHMTTTWFCSDRENAFSHPQHQVLSWALISQTHYVRSVLWIFRCFLHSSTSPWRAGKSMESWFGRIFLSHLSIFFVSLHPRNKPRTSLGKCSTDVLCPQLSFHSILRVCLTELTRLALNQFCSPGRPWTWGPTASAYSVAVITYLCHQAQFTFPSLCISNTHHQWTHYILNLLLTCYLYFLIECMC